MFLFLKLIGALMNSQDEALPGGDGAPAGGRHVAGPWPRPRLPWPWDFVEGTQLSMAQFPAARAEGRNIRRQCRAVQARDEGTLSPSE